MKAKLALFAAMSATMLAAAPALADHHNDGAKGHALHGPLHHGLMMAAAKESRADDKARDEFRHPVDTLAFFTVAPDMKVGEYAPGGGWYSRMLGNYLSEKGRLIGLFIGADAGPFDADRQQAFREEAASFPAKVNEWTGMPVDRVGGMTMDAIPESELGTYDRILVIRMLHNLTRWGSADTELRRMRDLLKDDGLIGIVQHRAKPDAPYAYSDGSKGYLREADVIAAMELNGFQFMGRSEMNANPKDSADHPKGVWEMPPVWSTKNEELKGLGESDRMTLLFRKRS